MIITSRHEPNQRCSLFFKGFWAAVYNSSLPTILFLEGCISCWQEKRHEKDYYIYSIIDNFNLGQDVDNNRERK